MHKNVCVLPAECSQNAVLGKICQNDTDPLRTDSHVVSALHIAATCQQNSMPPPLPDLGKRD